jgi:hypothetical protein
MCAVVLKHPDFKIGRIRGTPPRTVRFDRPNRVRVDRAYSSPVRVIASVATRPGGPVRASPISTNTSSASRNSSRRK